MFCSHAKKSLHPPFGCIFSNEFCISFSGKKKKIWNIYHCQCHPKSRVKDRFTTPAAYKLDQVNFLLFFRAEWWMSFRFLATLFFKCTHAPPASLFDLIALFCLFCGEFPLCLLALKAILLCQNTPLAWQGSSFQLISCFVGFDF